MVAQEDRAEHDAFRFRNSQSVRKQDRTTGAETLVAAGAVASFRARGRPGRRFAAPTATASLVS
jgi:hypothetical protein